MSTNPGYTPTSLDYINRPNPVEPLAAPPKHPLHGPPQLNQAYTQDLRRLLLDNAPRDASGEAASKRPKLDDTGKARSLPKLPVRSTDSGKERRTRLPPTLSGLHQPPPNAGLLPSINIAQHDQPAAKASNAPVPTTGSRSVEASKDSSQEGGSRVDAEATPKSPKSKPIKRNKWTDDETTCLLKGVARFGIGNWSQILKCGDYSFCRRTALDLKDRFRVCCPEQYAQGKPTQRGKQPPNQVPVRTRRNDRKGAADLAQLGVHGPLPKSGRRSRHGYSDVEDEALLRGFAKYGKSWASIQQDTELGLCHRKPTDLRDRFRQRYPDEYAKAGLAPRPKVFPAPPKRASDDVAESDPSNSSADRRAVEGASKDPDQQQPEHRKSSAQASGPQHFRQPPFVIADDVFFSLPADDEDAESEPIVLDRGILDWGLESARSGNDTSRNHSAMLPPSSSLAAGLNATGGLPSLATITSGNNDHDQLELPSMMQFFSNIDGDGRSTGQQGFPSLEELLNQS